MLPWQPFFGFLYMGAHWSHLLNTIEPSMCGGDAALCQVTLTTCLYIVWLCIFMVTVLGNGLVSCSHAYHHFWYTCRSWDTSKSMQKIHFK